MPIKLSNTLQKSDIDSQFIFDNMGTSQDVANFLEVPLEQLIYLLYKDPRKHYEIFKINKKTGGTRIIKKPIGSIAILQKKILPFIERKYTIKKPVHGFVKMRSVLSNAQQHLKKKYILNVDLKAFYDSINFGRIRGLFMSAPFNMGNNAATLLAQICCHDNCLPQGACTSPILSNFIASRLDRDFIVYAKKAHVTYSRYADDITFSSSKPFSKKVIIYDQDKNPILFGFILSDSFKEIIESNGFHINMNKVRLQTKHIRQEVTGITINNFPNVKRTFIRQIRAMLHSWKKDGLAVAELKHLEFKNKKIDLDKFVNNGNYFINVLVGKLAYLKMIRGQDDIILHKLCLEFTELTHKNLPKFIQEIKMSSGAFDVFICHASEDKETIARPLYESLTKRGVKAFLDEQYIQWGDSLTEKINHALGQSKYVIAILSDSSVGKSWPLKEINSTLAREIGGEKVLLPIVVKETSDIFKKLPLLADKLYKPWDNNAEELAKEIEKMLAS